MIVRILNPLNVYLYIYIQATSFVHYWNILLHFLPYSLHPGQESETTDLGRPTGRLGSSGFKGLLIGEMAMRMCHPIESSYFYSSLWLARLRGRNLLLAPLKVWGFSLATDFALLAEHISNTIQKGSEIPELNDHSNFTEAAATLCLALDWEPGLAA